MKIERTKNATRNIIYGVFLKIYQLLGPFILRTIFIYTLGMEYLGLNSLFTSILSVLNLAELGVGSALVFSMYKPIAEDDTEKICALMNLYKLYYRIIGAVILVIGLILVPFIPKLISGSVPEDINIYVLYLMNLGATVLSYWLFAYKTCLFGAHQRNDVTAKVTMISSTLQYIIQAVLLIIVANYYLYLAITLVTGVFNNLYAAWKCNKMFPNYNARGHLDKSEVKVISGKVRDLFTAKLGSVVIDSADTIVISTFLGLTTLAIYNNYFYIMSSIYGFIMIIFNACMAGVGNSLIVESEDKNYNDLKKFLYIVCWIASVCTCCLLGLYQPFMKMWVGEKSMLSFNLVICICIYFFVRNINTLINMYKDAAGMWHEDKWRPLVVSLANLGLNLILVHYIGLFGILLSTILTMVFIGMPWLIYNLFTVIFKRNAVEFILKMLFYTGLVCVMCVLTYAICVNITLTGVIGFLVKGIVIFGIANVIFLGATFLMPEFGQTKELILKIIKRNF